MGDRSSLAMPQDHWLPGFNFNVEEWFEGDHYDKRSAAHSNWPAPCSRLQSPRSPPTGS
jgi:hypothetical protein